MKKSTTKVLIVTRTKDRLIFLGRAIKSVEEQTFSDYIHVIINDGGDDEALDSFLKQFPSKKRKVIHNQKNIGMFASSNKAIQSVDSTYITMLDDDDTWAPERLQKAVEHLEATGDQAVVVKMDVVIEKILPSGKVEKISQQLHPESGDGEISLYKQCHKNYLSDGATVYRRSIYDELGGYDESLKTAGDWDFGIRFLMKHDVSLLRDEPSLVFYHQRPNATGPVGNAVHAGVDRQEKTLNMLRNRYLREDIKKGVFGVGYIMNMLAENDRSIVRLEAHINRTTQAQTEHTIRMIANNQPLAWLSRIIKKLQSML